MSASPDRDRPNGDHLNGTYVPVEEPSTASKGDVRLEVVQQKSHLLAMTRIAERLVGEVLHAPGEGLAHCRGAARCVERFVLDTIDNDGLEPLEGHRLDRSALVER